MPESRNPAQPSDPDQMAEDYRSAGFNRRLGFGERPAVLIVDMCQAYFVDDSPLCLPTDAAVAGCRSLLDAARAADIPVFWSRVEFEPGGANGGVFYRKVAALSVFDRGGPLGEWVPGLEPEADETVVTKQQASSFYDTDLAAALRQREIDTLVIAGVSTSGCVRATAVDACQYGFVPIVVDEACGDRSPELHRNTLFDLDAKYADVEPLAHVIEQLQRQSS